MAGAPRDGCNCPFSATPIRGSPDARGDTLSVAAADPQALPVPGPWSGLPQTPRLVEWRLFHGQRWTPWSVAVDFRHTEPTPRYFWDVYGVGTYQNSPAFANHIYLGMAGRYLFRLHIHSGRLRSGSYRIAVRVTDDRNNRSTTRWPLEIAH